MGSSMGPQPLFSWIHLSDIHIGHGGVTHVEDQKLVLDALRRDVERMRENGAPQPDAIFVTGDIAFSGACLGQDEYTRDFAELHASCGVLRDALSMADQAVEFANRSGEAFYIMGSASTTAATASWRSLRRASP